MVVVGKMFEEVQAAGSSKLYIYKYVLFASPQGSVEESFFEDCGSGLLPAGVANLYEDLRFCLKTEFACEQGASFKSEIPSK